MTITPKPSLCKFNDTQKVFETRIEQKSAFVLITEYRHGEGSIRDITKLTIVACSSQCSQCSIKKCPDA